MAFTCFHGSQTDNGEGEDRQGYNTQMECSSTTKPAPDGGSATTTTVTPNETGSEYPNGKTSATENPDGSSVTVVTDGDGNVVSMASVNLHLSQWALSTQL